MEDDKRNLLLSIQTTQIDLASSYPVFTRTKYPKKDHLVSLTQAMETCSNCHHRPDITGKIQHIESQIVDYRHAFGLYVNAKNNTKQADQTRLHASAIGDKSLIILKDMLIQTSTRLGIITREAKRGITWAWLTLAVTEIVLFVLSFMVARNFFKVITRPINTLVHATRMIASGNLGYTIDYQDKTEFGELASHFNTMSLSLKNGYAKLEHEIADRLKAEEQLAHDAFHDAMTGLPNRALFMDRLEHVITASHRRNAAPYYAVLFLDMDRFKIINDSLGHTIGDQVLVMVGRKLADCIRPGDTVARLGGDEFAILLKDIGELSHAIEVAERIRRKLTAPLDIKGQDIFVSLSIGITWGTELYERSEQVLRDADIAMYEAKERGESSYQVFDTKMHANIVDRMHMETELRRAVDHREFTLYYQPIMNLKTDQLIGFEALVRWKHPKRGLIYPMEFIPLAEENGLIHPIGEWILLEACRGLRMLQDRYQMKPPLTMSINISSKQFAKEDLPSRLSVLLSETGVDPQTVILEITESMIMKNVDAAVKTMNQLRNMGLHLHIDDFGTGHSSLSYLTRFPVNALKIDRSFINKLSADGTGMNREIIASIISLANSLKCAVIAEGVEMEHQLSNIQELHCDFGQGFLFARPMSFHAIDAWIQKQRHPGLGSSS
jgi:diguanylate cyclase (GGDEF)-like protein